VRLSTLLLLSICQSASMLLTASTYNWHAWSLVIPLNQCTLSQRSRRCRHCAGEMKAILRGVLVHLMSIFREVLVDFISCPRAGAARRAASERQKLLGWVHREEEARLGRILLRATKLRGASTSCAGCSSTCRRRRSCTIQRGSWPQGPEETGCRRRIW